MNSKEILFESRRNIQKQINGRFDTFVRDIAKGFWPHPLGTSSELCTTYIIEDLAEADGLWKKKVVIMLDETKEDKVQVVVEFKIDFENPYGLSAIKSRGEASIKMVFTETTGETKDFLKNEVQQYFTEGFASLRRLFFVEERAIV